MSQFCNLWKLFIFLFPSVLKIGSPLKKKKRLMTQPLPFKESGKKDIYHVSTNLSKSLINIVLPHLVLIATSWGRCNYPCSTNRETEILKVEDACLLPLSIPYHLSWTLTLLEVFPPLPGRASPPSFVPKLYSAHDFNVISLHLN